jgi:hypothetical protein
MDHALGERVRQRAANRCEYCHLPQSSYPLTFPIDHVVALQHGGATNDENLALACPFCNSHKGPNVAGIDPTTQQVTPLFHPRRDRFHWHGNRLAGATAIARVTIIVLAMNHSDQLALRSAMMNEPNQSAGWL